MLSHIHTPPTLPRPATGAEKATSPFQPGKKSPPTRNRFGRYDRDVIRKDSFNARHDGIQHLVRTTRHDATTAVRSTRGACGPQYRADGCGVPGALPGLETTPTS
ncbi:hypothetical protein MRB53_035435 [Persea americana]|uniref:Uncharacterized protein n=1 Tax=Persea americana TaxID=3435 RepID=A0ACC2K558_PERAE|nr:hypothetical protein MRB53_035435 [Persea americana]